MTDDSSLGVLIPPGSCMFGKRYYLVYPSAQNTIQLRNLFISLGFEDNKTIIVITTDSNGSQSTHAYINGLSTMPGGNFKRRDKIFDINSGGIKCHPVIRKVGTNECERQVKLFLCKLGNNDKTILDEKVSKIEKEKQRKVYTHAKQNKEVKDYSIGRRTIFYPSTWHQSIISKIEDFSKQIPQNCPIILTNEFTLTNKYKIYWIVTNRKHDDAEFLTTHLSSTFANVICDECSANAIDRIRNRLVKNSMDTRYVIVFSITKFCDKDYLEYKLIDFIRRGQISASVKLKYIPLIIIISPRPPNYRQTYINRNDFLPYQVSANNGKMILNDDISDYDFNLEVTERNANALKKYTVRRNDVINQINNFKKEYISKNVTTADTSLLTSLENQLKHINETEQKFKNNIDNYFRETIGFWNVSEYACRVCNYVEDYILVEMKIPAENNLPKTTQKINNLPIPLRKKDVTSAMITKKEEIESKYVLVIKPVSEHSSDSSGIDKSMSGKKRDIIEETEHKIVEASKEETIQIIPSSNIVLGKRRTFQ